MAVNPVRAVLSAHLAATWNRSRRELGKSGALAFALVMGVLVLAAGAPVVLGSALFGYLLLGPKLAEPAQFGPILGATLAMLGFFGGVVGGILGGSRVLAWESYRSFPLRLPALFLAELASNLGDPLGLGMSAMSCFLLLGVGLAHPALLPLLLPLALATVASMLAVQHLVGSLAAQVVKRAQVALVLLGILAWSGVYLVPGRAQAGPKKPAIEEVDAFAQRARALGPALGRALAWLPTTQAALGLSDAGRGAWGRALARQVPLLATAALLLLLGAWTLGRESGGEALRARPAGRGPERLWTFAGPRAGLARLHLHNLLGSHLGRFSLLIPLMTLVLLKGPLAMARGAQLWTLPAAFGYLALTGIQFQMNQFGMDGGGVKALLLLPVPTRVLLEGKVLGLAAFQALQALLLLSLLGLGGLLTPAGALAGLCLSACLFLAQASVGHWTSAWLPRPMPRDSLKNSAQSPLAVWLSMAAASSAMALYGGTFLLASWLAPALLLPLMAALLGLTLLAYLRLVLPAATAFTDARRETLLKALS